MLVSERTDGLMGSRIYGRADVRTDERANGGGRRRARAQAKNEFLRHLSSEESIS